MDTTLITKTILTAVLTIITWAGLTLGPTVHAEIVSAEFTTDALMGSGAFAGATVTGTYSYDTAAAGTAGNFPACFAFTVSGGCSPLQKANNVNLGTVYPITEFTLTINGETVTTTDGFIAVGNCNPPTGGANIDRFAIASTSAFTGTIGGLAIVSASLDFIDNTTALFDSDALPSSPPSLANFSSSAIRFCGAGFDHSAPVAAHEAAATMMAETVPTLGEWGIIILIMAFATSSYFKVSRMPKHEAA